MARCLNCRRKFNVAATRAEYNLILELDGELDYDKDGDGLCFDCAIPPEVSSNIKLGRAIMAWTGDADYDPDNCL